MRLGEMWLLTDLEFRGHHTQLPPLEFHGEFQGHHTQLRRDWSLLDLAHAAYDFVRIDASRAISERSHPCAGETGSGRSQEGRQRF